jgi:hypothetical protein
MKNELSRAGRKVLTSDILSLLPENNSDSNRVKAKFETVKLTLFALENIKHQQSSHIARSFVLGLPKRKTT